MLLTTHIEKKSCLGHFIKENVLCKDGEISSTSSNIYRGDYIESRANEPENFLKTWEKTRNSVRCEYTQYDIF